jgi:uncharacterized membrane protein YfcA
MLQDIILLLTGILVGAMNAIAGGGMLLGFPIMLATGISPIHANASTAIVTLPGALSSAYGYRKYLRQIPIQYAWLIVPCVIGATIGAIILRRTPPGHFEQIVPGLVLFAVLLFAVQPLLHFNLHRHLHGKSKGDFTLAWISIGFLPTAVYGGYFGAGFGFIVLAFLGFTSLNEMHKMNALKNIAAASIAIASIATLWTSGLIDWHHGLVMAIGSSVGGFSGAKLSQGVPTHAFRIGVVGFGLLAVVYLAFRSY